LIRTATHDDIQAVARVHAAAFPDAFMTELGLRFLAAYYLTVLEYPLGVVLIEGPAGRVSGFAAAVAEPGVFYRQLRNGWTRLLQAATRPLVANPLLALRAGLKGLRSPRRQTYRPTNIPDSRLCELTSIGVSPDERRAGVGTTLVAAVIQWARDRGCDLLYLSTDKHENAPANEFYQALGFEVVEVRRREGGRVMAYYARHLGMAEPTAADLYDPFAGSSQGSDSR